MSSKQREDENSSSGSEYTDDEDGDEYEDEESEDGSDSSSEGEEEEPKLKYMRLGSSVIEILKDDAATCMAVHEKFLAMGTQSGNVHILDFNGNLNRTLKHHTVSINELSVDDCGEYIASCSNDGKVNVNPLYGEGESLSYSSGRPILSVALNPDFYRQNTKEYVCGGKSGDLLLNKKGLIGIFGPRTTTIHQGEGPVYTVKWRGPFIAWANDKGVKIYDCTTSQRITFIDRPKDPPPPRPDLYRCNLCWEEDDLLLIGWGDFVQICQVKERRNAYGGLPTRYVEIIRFFRTDFFICGIAPFGEYLILLAYNEEPGSNKGQRPELRILTRDNQEISSDALTIRDYERNTPHQYRLDHLASESLYYIVSPKDIVNAKPRDIDDHISWLLQQKDYEKALDCAITNSLILVNHTVVEIGEKYLLFLIESNKFEQAAELCSKILGKNEKLWEKWIYTFSKIGKLSAITQYIPIANPQLSQQIYEMVLTCFLHSNIELFQRLIVEWPYTIYNIQNIILKVLDKIRKENESTIPPYMDALAKLYTYDKQYDKTLQIYLRLKRGNVFQLIEKHGLYDFIQDKVSSLIQFNPAEGIRLLVNNTDRIPIPTVITQLSYEPKMQYQYLHALFQKDPDIASRFHELQLKLYTEFDHAAILPFLKQSNSYSLDSALKLFTEKKYYPEMVYILGKMGNIQQALELIIEKLGDVVMAINFVQDQNDEQLWGELIEHSIKNPKFVSGLLEHIGAHIDPLQIIKKINGLEIVGLRDKLRKIFFDFNLQMSLREDCNVILKADCVSLTEKFIKTQKHAVKVDLVQKCSTCNNIVIQGKESPGITLFYCSHIYHTDCLGGKLFCSICQKDEEVVEKKGNIIVQ